MKTLLTNLTLKEATEAIQGTTYTMYREDWAQDDFDPAEVAVAFDENGDVYDVADDEVVSLTMEDIMANDWCVLGDEGDHELFDEGLLKVLDGIRTMEGTNVDSGRHMLWGHLSHLLSAYIGRDAYVRFLETGKFVHDELCECPDCFRAQMEQNPEKAMEEFFKSLAELFDKENGKDVH